MAIRRGDFVDVGATVEVVTMRGKHGRKVEVHVCPQEVVRLKSAAEANVSATELVRRRFMLT